MSHRTQKPLQIQLSKILSHYMSLSEQVLREHNHLGALVPVKDAQMFNQLGFSLTLMGEGPN